MKVPAPSIRPSMTKSTSSIPAPATSADAFSTATSSLSPSIAPLLQSTDSTTKGPPPPPPPPPPPKTKTKMKGNTKTERTLPQDDSEWIYHSFSQPRPSKKQNHDQTTNKKNRRRSPREPHRQQPPRHQVVKNPIFEQDKKFLYHLFSGKYFQEMAATASTTDAPDSGPVAAGRSISYDGTSTNSGSTYSTISGSSSSEGSATTTSTSTTHCAATTADGGGDGGGNVEEAAGSTNHNLRPDADDDDDDDSDDASGVQSSLQTTQMTTASKPPSPPPSTASSVAPRLAASASSAATAGGDKWKCFDAMCVIGAGKDDNTTTKTTTTTTKTEQDEGETSTIKEKATTTRAAAEETSVQEEKEQESLQSPPVEEPEKKEEEEKMEVPKEEDPISHQKDVKEEAKEEKCLKKVPTLQQQEKSVTAAATPAILTAGSGADSILGKSVVVPLEKSLFDNFVSFDEDSEMLLAGERVEDEEKLRASLAAPGCTLTISSNNFSLSQPSKRRAFGCADGFVCGGKQCQEMAASADGGEGKELGTVSKNLDEILEEDDDESGGIKEEREGKAVSTRDKPSNFFSDLMGAKYCDYCRQKLSLNERRIKENLSHYIEEGSVYFHLACHTAKESIKVKKYHVHKELLKGDHKLRRLQEPTTTTGEPQASTQTTSARNNQSKSVARKIKNRFMRRPRPLKRLRRLFRGRKPIPAASASAAVPGSIEPNTVEKLATPAPATLLIPQMAEEGMGFEVQADFQPMLSETLSI